MLSETGNLESRRAARTIDLITVAGLFFLLAWSTIEFTREFSRIALVWPANGVLLAYMLTSGRRQGIRLVAACLPANVLANLMTGDAPPVAVLLSLCNTLEVTFVAWMLGARFTRDLASRRLSYAKNFVLYGVLAGPVLSAALASAVLYALQGADTASVFKTWFMADSLGIALITPLALVIRRPDLFGADEEILRLPFILHLCLAGLVTSLVFAQSEYPLLFVIMPVLALIAFRYGLYGLSVSLIVFASIAMAATVMGTGPTALMQVETLENRALLVQIFILFTELSTVPVALAIEERRRLEAKLATANKRLESMALTDALTGLPNRRSFNERFDREWAAAQRDNTSLAVAFIDVDFFKLFNDTQGHRAGDDCLSALGGLMMETIFRPRDFIARYGGEEFVLVMPDTDLKGARLVCERLRGIVAGARRSHPRSPHSILTVSIGYAAKRPDLKDSREHLLDEADRALYSAKWKGRNRTEGTDSAVLPVLENS